MEPISAQQVLQAAFGEEEEVQVWNFDPARGEAALCRVWLRRGSCKWGALCRHGHDIDLSAYSLRARRGAAMPHLVRGDAKASLESDTVAFVVCGNRAVYDYEDPWVAQRFLAPETAGTHLWSLLPLELAVQTLWSAGSSGAQALLTCKDWHQREISQKMRELTYQEATGAEFPDCSARELSEVMLARRLLLSAQAFSTKSDYQCSPVAQVPQPAPCLAVLLDEAVVFAVLQSGEIRCHRSSTGQLLASSPRLSKGRLLQAATLGKAFILGDDHGGVHLVQRDDLSETKQLRSSGKSAICALAALKANQEAYLCASMDGSLELIQVSDEDSRIQLLAELGAFSMAPALCAFAVGEERVLVSAGPHHLWTWSPGGLKAVAQSRWSGQGICHACSLNDKLVIATTAGCRLQWWSLHGEELRPDGETQAFRASNVGKVVDLCAYGDICASLHANLTHPNLTVVLWQGSSKAEVARIEVSGLGQSLALGAGCLAIASFAGAGRSRAGTNVLHLATQPLFVEKVLKEPKKSKPAKMFAHKSKGGYKNLKTKHAR
mmetsp:Transcript_116211/g.276219  ORF Transcript_116211/g.276219 Transcript_116211/m.276219 type:complete len:549 (-) Transcript_116211:106-1752(-)